MSVTLSDEQFQMFMGAFNAVVDEVDELQTEVKELREDKEELAEDVDEKTDDLLRRVSMLEGGQSTLEKKVEEQSTETPTPEGTEQATICEPETPLEDMVQLPESAVDEHLTANQERARFVAKDIRDYSKSVLAGRAIRSGELRRVLSAKEDRSVETETASRVIKMLNKFGKDEVQIEEDRQGERIVVFSDEIASRIAALQSGNNGVVIGAEV